MPETLVLSAKKFVAMEGIQRAAAFSFNAFLAFFPLVLLIVIVFSALFGNAVAGKAVITYMENYAPAGGEIQHLIFGTVSGILKARGEAGIFVFIILIFAASQFLTVMVRATNKAWGLRDYPWWRDPLKDLSLLGVMIIIVFMGIAVPLAGNMVRSLLQSFIFFSWAYSLWMIFLPWLALFIGLSLFYKLAPHRHTLFSEVWIPALLATALLHFAQTVFVIYLKRFSALALMYGALGGVIAMLLWIYISGVIFIFCACLCAAQAEISPSQRP